MNTTSNDVPTQDVPPLASNINRVEHDTNTTQTTGYPAKHRRAHVRVIVQILFIMALGYVILAIIAVFTGLLFLASSPKPLPNAVNDMVQNIILISTAAIFMTILAIGSRYLFKKISAKYR